jgi:hypothetical protein
MIDNQALYQQAYYPPTPTRLTKDLRTSVDWQSFRLVVINVKNRMMARNLLCLPSIPLFSSLQLYGKKSKQPTSRPTYQQFLGGIAG